MEFPDLIDRKQRAERRHHGALAPLGYDVEELHRAELGLEQIRTTAAATFVATNAACTIGLATPGDGFYVTEQWIGLSRGRLRG